jgi:hypothetical protein
MTRVELQALIDRVIGTKGIMRSSSWWVRKLFNKVLEYVESYVDAAVKKIKITCDTEMSDTSMNPVGNKVIKKYVDDAVKEVKITCDTEMSDTSTNPVGNKVIKKYVDDGVRVIDDELKTLKDEILKNEDVTAAAFIDLNDRVSEIISRLNNAGI